MLKNEQPFHYRTAMRLDRDASYMGIKNLFAKDNKALFARFMQAVACVDTEWLKSEGYALPEPFLPELFTYTIELAEKYEKIRMNKAIRALSKLKKVF